MMHQRDHSIIATSSVTPVPRKRGKMKAVRDFFIFDLHVLVSFDRCSTKRFEPAHSISILSATGKHRIPSESHHIEKMEEKEKNIKAEEEEATKGT